MRLIQAKVSEELFKSFSHYLVERDLTVAECVSEWIEANCAGLAQVMERKQVKVKPEVHPLTKALDAVEKVKVAPVVPSIRALAYVEPREVPMAKCRKCFDTFPVADMVTDPKSGKLFCGGCVENMRNQQ